VHFAVFEEVRTLGEGCAAIWERALKGTFVCVHPKVVENVLPLFEHLVAVGEPTVDPADEAVGVFVLEALHLNELVSLVASRLSLQTVFVFRDWKIFVNNIFLYKF
jgi:hypothetical protein